MTFTTEQTEQLLRPIAPSRILKDGKGHSHVSQQDVTAHLIRVFGFGGFDTEILDVQCIFEHERVNDKGQPQNRFDVCYRALLRLSVKDANGNVVATYDDGSTATAQNQTRGDAHDLAYKSALSLAKKRAAINLGDQFGLSLYNKGQETALVKGTLVHPEAAEVADGDVQAGVEQQVSLGNDETDPDPEPAAQQPAPPPDTTDYATLIAVAGSQQELRGVAAKLGASTLSDTDKQPHRDAYRSRWHELEPQPVPA